jgi:uncharacterized protein (TIGR03000 family)
MARQCYAVARIAALATAALLLATGLSFAAGHGGGGGGHGGGGHGGGGHGGGGHGGGGFHSGGFHNGGFHNGNFHNGHFHNGSNFFLGVGLGGWGWGGYGGYYGDYGGYPGSYDGWYTGDYTVPVSTQDAYPSVPDASTYSSLGTAPGAAAAPLDENAVYIRVQVPPDADVWFEGQKTVQKGPVRFFESPPVTPGIKYVYHIRAHWKEGGQDIDEVREATVYAGSKVGIDFTRRAREKVPPPVPK